MDFLFKKQEPKEPPTEKQKEFLSLLISLTESGKIKWELKTTAWGELNCWSKVEDTRLHFAYRDPSYFYVENYGFKAPELCEQIRAVVLRRVQQAEVEEQEKVLSDMISKMEAM